MTTNFFLSAMIPMALLFLLLFVLKRMISKSGKDTEKFFLVSVLVIGSFLMFTYIALLYIKDVFTPPLITVGSVDAWIGFSGSILGAFITVFALSFTIGNERNIRVENEKKEEEKRKEQLAQDLIPIINVSPRVDKDRHLVSTSSGESNLSARFQISNISENHARHISIRIHSLDIFNDKIKQKVDLLSTELDKVEEIQLLPSKSDRFFSIPIASYKMDSLYSDVTSSGFLNFEMDLYVSVYDVHLLMEHIFVIHVKGSLSENLLDPIIFLYDDNGDSVGELYNKYNCRITTCLADLK